MTSDRDERFIAHHNWSGRDLIERVIDLEDELKLFKTNQAYLVKVNEGLSPNNLDPDRLDSALRMYVAELDYDIHKMIESPEDGRPDQYPDEVNFFLRCWETAGEE